jgi:3-dehydro-L-gulonate 2-dehydrogenase
MRIPFDKMKDEFLRILTATGFTPVKAELCARIFAENSRDGVYSHGLNRFPVFIKMVREGMVNKDAEPGCTATCGSIEYWDGFLGPGMYNATVCMDRAIAIGREKGIGMVVLKNTNHWMRGGTYGWQAANEGCIGICTTNTIANMPPWGGKEPRLGNNPLVIAVPHPDGHVVLDMAISQYSYGALQQYKLDGKKLPVTGGYDEEGNLTNDPASIYQSQRVLPIGFWKGSGLSLVLDVMLTALSGGRSVKAITDGGKEIAISQLFISIYQENLHQDLVKEILAYTKSSAPAEEGGKISFPGENTLRTRKENLRDGIPVNEKIWNEIKSLQAL